MCRKPVVGEDDTSVDESLNQVIGWLLNQVGPERFAVRVYFGMLSSSTLEIRVMAPNFGWSK